MGVVRRLPRNAIIPSLCVLSHVWIWYQYPAPRKTDPRTNPRLHTTFINTCQNAASVILHVHFPHTEHVFFIPVQHAPIEVCVVLTTFGNRMEYPKPTYRDGESLFNERYADRFYKVNPEHTGKSYRELKQTLIAHPTIRRAMMEFLSEHAEYRRVVEEWRRANPRAAKKMDKERRAQSLARVKRKERMVTSKKETPEQRKARRNMERDMRAEKRSLLK